MPTEKSAAGPHNLAALPKWAQGWVFDLRDRVGDLALRCSVYEASLHRIAAGYSFHPGYSSPKWAMQHDAQRALTTAAENAQEWEDRSLAVVRAADLFCSYYEPDYGSGYEPEHLYPPGRSSEFFDLKKAVDAWRMLQTAHSRPATDHKQAG